MTNKILLLPLLAFKVKTALAIKTGLSLFGLGLGSDVYSTPPQAEENRK